MVGGPLGSHGVAEIEGEIEGGRYATAVRKLRAILDQRPAWDEALYLLGTCEMARGRPQPAADSWARVAPDSRFAAPRHLRPHRGRDGRGRLTAAEQIIRDALDDPRIDASSLPILLGPIYCQQGRLAETLRMLETRWDALDRTGEGASELAIDVVRAHIDLQQREIPVEVIRSSLDHAAGLAPDDDRIWLGQANLAIRTGRSRKRSGGSMPVKVVVPRTSRSARPARLGIGVESRRGGA